MPFHEPTALKRLERSVYLWREPVEGILDWGEDSWQEKPHSMMAGFSGTRPIPTVAREHVRQAYVDLDHLAMLESLTAAAPPSAARDAAAGFLDWLRTRHSDNFKREGARIGNPRYFDDLRATVVELILRLSADQRQSGDRGPSGVHAAETAGAGGDSYNARMSRSR